VYSENRGFHNVGYLVTHITSTCANDGVGAFSHCIKGFERFNVNGETRLKLQCEQEALVMFFTGRIAPCCIVEGANRDLVAEEDFRAGKKLG